MARRMMVAVLIGVLIAVASPLGVSDGFPTGTSRGSVAQAAPRHQVWIPSLNGEVGPGSQAAAPAESGSPFVFGVYPGGGTGETPNAAKPSAAAVAQRLKQLAGGRAFNVHLYTAWSWHGDWLDTQIKSYTDNGLGVVLTIKYSPPAGREGDVAGYEAFVRSIVRKYGGNPRLISFCIGNEANVYGNPEASDGPFKGAEAAVARGVIAAAQELTAMGSNAQVGFNFAINDNGSQDAAFVQRLAQLGGPAFTSAVKVVGVQVYPGIWYSGSQPYSDMVRALTSGRSSVDSVAALRGLPIEVLETGAPILDQEEQAGRLQQFVQATLDHRTKLNIVHFNWFDLWDADSSSTDPFAHYGLLRSDLSEKPAFGVYSQIIAGLA